MQRQSQWRLRGQVCNRGGGPAPPPVAGTFYDGAPRMGGRALCTARTTRLLLPGECENISCVWMMPPQGARDLWFRVGDDGTNRAAGSARGATTCRCCVARPA